MTSPIAGTGGTAGAASAASHAYSPDDCTPISRSVPVVGAVLDATARHALAASSQRTTTNGRPASIAVRFGTLTRLSPANGTPCGAMSTTATGDQPGGRSAWRPCADNS